MYAPRPSQYHKRKARWEKSGVKPLKKKLTIKEVRFSTWFTNIVMVEKANEKWRMCTDYIVLNKTFPKDAYPLPNIDRFVDGASGFQVLSFLDVYSKYSQIRMHPPDEDKMTLITEDANFFYKVMPFDLKNIGATY